MKDFAHTVTTAKPVDAAVRAVDQATAAHGFRVLHTHNIAATLAEKGFPREPLKQLEICNAPPPMKGSKKTSRRCRCCLPSERGRIFTQRRRGFSLGRFEELFLPMQPELMRDAAAGKTNPRRMVSGCAQPVLPRRGSSFFESSIRR